uniref:Uncharacterized protein n=1 Tax=Leersia perrieri TaxID=77586 RepID=A0A0D9VFX0_9ORYZ
MSQKIIFELIFALEHDTINAKPCYWCKGVGSRFMLTLTRLSVKRAYLIVWIFQNVKACGSYCCAFYV